MTLNLVDNKEVVVLDNWVETIPWTDKTAKALHGVLAEDSIGSLMDEVREMGEVLSGIERESFYNMLFEIRDLQPLLDEHGHGFQKNLQTIAEDDMNSIHKDAEVISQALSDMKYKMNQLTSMRKLLINKKNSQQSKIVLKEGREWFVVPVEKQGVEKVS